MLERLGYRADTATDGAEAVELYRQALAARAPYVAVILDLMVPGGMAGAGALQCLRELDPGVRAIVSSGYANDPAMTQFAKHGFAGVLHKPSRLEEMEAMLRRVLAG